MSAVPGLLRALGVAVRDELAETQLELARGEKRADHRVLFSSVSQRTTTDLAQPE